MTDFAATAFRYLHRIFLPAALVLMLYSCGVYPKDQPFVYSSEVHIEGKYSTDEKKQLKSELENQIHDSLIPRRKMVLFIIPKLQNPPVFDTLNVSKSKAFMSAQLNSLGYYRDTIYDSVRIVRDGDKLKTYVDFYVHPGKLIHLDSVSYVLSDSLKGIPEVDTLQELTDANPELRLLRRGAPFSKPLISGELDRLTNVYRNNGYLRFSKEQLVAVWDTVGISLLRPAVDLEEQLQLLEALRQRREKPVADIQIMLKPDTDRERLKRYYVGNVVVYPDHNPVRNTAESDSSFVSIVRQGTPYYFVSYDNLFHPRKIIRFIYLKQGDLYRQSNYLKTQNKFNSLSAWRSVTIEQYPRLGQDTVDFKILLTPAKKFAAGVNFDVSRNQGNLGIEGGLLGLGANFNLVNRNFLKAANQSTLHFRYGVELATRIDSIQTQQFTLSYNIQFPRLVPRFNFIDRELRENARTFLSFNLGQTDRVDYFRVFSLNTSMGWELSRDKIIHSFRWPNIEYNILDPRHLLKELILQNVSYKYIFNDGLIVSGLYNATFASGRTNRTNLFRLSVELAGMPGLIKEIFPEAKVYSFAKLDMEYVRHYNWRRTALVFRVFGGLGKTRTFALDSGQPDTINFYLPFFRQYYAGGPNSMRAWSVRKLGPGSSVKSFDKTIAPDRFGDMRLEGNIEYRFFIAKVAGYNVEGATFVDMGNVWFLRDNPDFDNDQFNLGRLWKDLAIGVGAGIRTDFKFLKVRADFGYKAKDPSPGTLEAQNKWFYNWALKNAQFQLGIDYPF